MCNNPAPSDGGRACGGGATGTVKCNTAPCRTVVDGGFRYPYCLANIFLVSNNSNVINYSFRNGGELNRVPHVGVCNRITTYHENPAPSEWFDWGKCSKKCGSGTMTRWRACNNPKPMRGGKQCEGANTASQACNTQGCPGIVILTDLQLVSQP